MRLPLSRLAEPGSTVRLAILSKSCQRGRMRCKEGVESTYSPGLGAVRGYVWCGV